ncbi:septum formation family protein [Labedella endophytica]|nr:septum formation family protein [Labedella endophytica]
MSRRSVIRRLALGAAAATSVVALLTGCSAINGLMGGETRDESGEIVEGGDTDIFAIAEGDCISDEATVDGEVSDVPTVPCDDPHTWEVFKNVTMTDDEYPGLTAAQDFAEGECLAEFEAFAGIAYEESVHELNYYTPTEESWAMDDRTINCLIGGVQETTGTLRGAGE